MRILTRLLLTGLALPAALHAQTSPYIRLTGGLLAVNPGHHQTVHFNPSYWKTAMTDQTWRVTPYGGLSAGIRIPLAHQLSSELGAGLYAAAPFSASGDIYQYGSPQFNNLTYQYQIQHTRLMLEGKLLSAHHDKYHPYLSAGIGVSRQHSQNYEEAPKAPYAIIDPAFTADTTYSLAYSVGIGVDVDINPSWRVGGGYELTQLGSATLGKAAEQATSQRISSGTLYANQFMLQFTYAG